MPTGPGGEGGRECKMEVDGVCVKVHRNLRECCVYAIMTVELDQEPFVNKQRAIRGLSPVLERRRTSSTEARRKPKPQGRLKAHEESS